MQPGSKEPERTWDSMLPFVNNDSSWYGNSFLQEFLSRAMVSWMPTFEEEGSGGGHSRHPIDVCWMQCKSMLPYDCELLFTLESPAHNTMLNTWLMFNKDLSDGWINWSMEPAPRPGHPIDKSSQDDQKHNLTEPLREFQPSHISVIKG